MMSRDPYSVILRPLQSEKATQDAELNNAYHFEVATGANKIEIAEAIVAIYDPKKDKKIKVTKVRIINHHPKFRRMRLHYAATKAWKKAIVFIDKESKLELF